MTSRVNLTTMVSDSPFRILSGDTNTTLALGESANQQIQFKTSDLPKLVEVVTRAAQVWVDAKAREALINVELKTP